MVMIIQTPSSKSNLKLEAEISEAGHEGILIETAAHDGVVITIDDYDECGNHVRYKLELSTDDIATINRVRR